MTATWRAARCAGCPTFLGFPAGGVVAHLVAGPVDGVAAALLGGAITGAVLGAVQAWGDGDPRPAAGRWIAATTAGLAAGLALGSAAVGYGTSLGELVAQGAICGLAIGTAQALVLRGRAAYLWAPALSALWALGWAISTSIGVDVDTRWTVFGASGALMVTAATAACPRCWRPARCAARHERRARALGGAGRAVPEPARHRRRQHDRQRRAADARARPRRRRQRAAVGRRRLHARVRRAAAAGRRARRSLRAPAHAALRPGGLRRRVGLAPPTRAASTG